VLDRRHARERDRWRHLRRAGDAAELHISRRHLSVVVLLRQRSRQARARARRSGRGGDVARARHRAGAGSRAARAVDGRARVVPRGGAVIDRPRAVAIAAVLIVGLVMPVAGAAQERKGYVLDWDSGTGKSYVIPAAEILGFVGALNAFDRLVID